MAIDDDRVRASDAERQQVIDLLRRHAADGRLTMDEYGDRVSEALAATTRGDLPPVLRDLPTLPDTDTDTDAPRRPRTPRLPTVPGRTVMPIVAAVVALAVIVASDWQLWWVAFIVWPMIGGCGRSRGCAVGDQRDDAHARSRATGVDDDREVIRV